MGLKVERKPFETEYNIWIKVDKNSEK